MITIELTKRGKLAYFEIMGYLIEEPDFKIAFIKTIDEEIEKYKSFKINLMYWITYNLLFTLDEKSLIGSWIDKYGMLPLPVEDSIWKIYSKYLMDDILIKIDATKECNIKNRIEGV